MIDTIKLKISNSVFKIMDYRQFNTTEEIFNSTMASFLVWPHKTTYLKNKLEYLPKVTIIQTGSNYYLIVEFSAPKIMFGENVSELTNKDFKPLLRKLKKILYGMGIGINHKYLANASVLEIHPSKNLLLGQKYEPIEILRELRKVNVDLYRYDIDVKNYRNGGEILQFYNGESAIVFYDKIADLKKPITRSIDKDKVGLIPGAIDQKILRYEVRLENKKKVNQALSWIGEKQNIKLVDIFNSDICRKILIKYWNEFFGTKCEIYQTNQDQLTELNTIFKYINNIKIKELIFCLGLKYLLSNADGFMGVIKYLSKKYKPSSIKALKQDMDRISTILPNPRNRFMDEIEIELKKFKPIKKVKYYYGYEEQKAK